MKQNKGLLKNHIKGRIKRTSFIIENGNPYWVMRDIVKNQKVILKVLQFLLNKKENE